VGDAVQHSDVQSLAHRVGQQPFSVVLLDEFEKAHPNAWDLFLQVFDDGLLTDAMGHMSHFRHSIIILTSNLEPSSRRALASASSSASFSPDQVIRTIHQTFRPEFINRLDAVIVFRPLSRELMRGNPDQGAGSSARAPRSTRSGMGGRMIRTHRTIRPRQRQSSPTCA
jgi:ATP-dependent Clp protease ATP-binding subunit ClpA